MECHPKSPSSQPVNLCGTLYVHFLCAKVFWGIFEYKWMSWKGFLFISFACKNASEYFCTCKSILRHFCIQMIGLRMPFFSYLLYAKMPQNTFALISCSGLPQSRAASIRPAPAGAVNAICCWLCHVKDRYFFVMALILLFRFIVSATMLYTPCLEHMTVAIKEPTVTKPKYRLSLCLLLTLF